MKSGFHYLFCHIFSHCEWFRFYYSKIKAWNFLKQRHHHHHSRAGDLLCGALGPGSLTQPQMWQLVCEQMQKGAVVRRWRPPTMLHEQRHNRCGGSEEKRGMDIKVGEGGWNQRLKWISRLVITKLPIMSDSLFINPVNTHLFVGVTKGSDLSLSFSDLLLSSEAKQVRV